MRTSRGSCDHDGLIHSGTNNKSVNHLMLRQESRTNKIGNKLVKVKVKVITENCRRRIKRRIRTIGDDCGGLIISNIKRKEREP